jgi:hypothetical protein
VTKVYSFFLGLIERKRRKIYKHGISYKKKTDIK